MTMLKKWACACCVGVLTTIGGTAHATPVLDLANWVFKVDGSSFCDGFSSQCVSTLPGSVNGSGFDFGLNGLHGTGLGTITASFSGAGNHYFDAMLDHEIAETSNTAFNEYGVANGTAASGQSWEIDDPGFNGGDNILNAYVGTLDNTNSVPIGDHRGSPNPCCDVSMALGWGFMLTAGQTATVSLLVSQVQPTSGFFLQQVDPQSNVNLYFSGALSVKSPPPAGVPEPGSLLLMGPGLLMLYHRSRRHRTAPA